MMSPNNIENTVSIIIGHTDVYNIYKILRISNILMFELIAMLGCTDLSHFLKTLHKSIKIVANTYLFAMF